MADQVIDGTLDIRVPGASTPIRSLTITVQSFATGPNAQASHYILARDIGAAPPNGFTHFIVRGDGNVGVGTPDPSARLDVKGTTIIEGPSSGSPFTVLQVNAGSFGNVNNMLNSSFITASDIGAAPPAGDIKFRVRGDGSVFSRGVMGAIQGVVTSAVALAQNSANGGFVQVSGVGGQARVVLSENTGDGGFAGLLGPAGQQMIQLSGVLGSPDNGSVSVTDAGGAAAGLAKAQLIVDGNGKGTLIAEVKNFRVPNPDQAGTDIVYACIEGPEVAAYARGTATLVDGKCTVDLPDHFVNVTADNAMTAHVTPLSADSLGLAVVEKNDKQIVVAELQKGVGNYSFDWEVKSVRTGHEDYRVIRPQEEMKLEGHVPASADAPSSSFLASAVHRDSRDTKKR
jgi:hypothetical protein